MSRPRPKGQPHSRTQLCPLLCGLSWACLLEPCAAIIYWEAALSRGNTHGSPAGTPSPRSSLPHCGKKTRIRRSQV